MASLRREGGQEARLFAGSRRDKSRPYGVGVLVGFGDGGAKKGRTRRSASLHDSLPLAQTPYIGFNEVCNND
jgi:hypothetical protein